MPDLKPLREGRIYDGSQFKGASTVAGKAWGQRWEAAGHRVHSQERRCCLLFILSRAPTHRMVLPTFTVGHPASS